MFTPFIHTKWEGPYSQALYNLKRYESMINHVTFSMWARSPKRMQEMPWAVPPRTTTPLGPNCSPKWPKNGQKMNVERLMTPKTNPYCKRMMYDSYRRSFIKILLVKV